MFLERKGAPQDYTAHDYIHFLAGAEQQQIGQSAWALPMHTGESSLFTAAKGKVFPWQQKQC